MFWVDAENDIVLLRSFGVIGRIHIGIMYFLVSDYEKAQ